MWRPGEAKISPMKRMCMRKSQGSTGAGTTRRRGDPSFGSVLLLLLRFSRLRRHRCDHFAVVLANDQRSIRVKRTRAGRTECRWQRCNYVACGCTRQLEFVACFFPAAKSAEIRLEADGLSSVSDRAYRPNCELYCTCAVLSV